MSLLMCITKCSQRSGRLSILNAILQKRKLGLRFVRYLSSFRAPALSAKQLQGTLGGGPTFTAAGRDPNDFT